jgi:hypothetical protein
MMAVLVVPSAGIETGVLPSLFVTLLTEGVSSVHCHHAVQRETTSRRHEQLSIWLIEPSVFSVTCARQTQGPQAQSGQLGISPVIKELAVFGVNAVTLESHALHVGQVCRTPIS